MEELNDIEKKILNGERLSEYELSDIIFEFPAIDTIKGDNNRWTRCMSTIIGIGDDNNMKYFRVDWEQGLTEAQDHRFNNQPYEVEPEERRITTTVMDWNEVE